ncbi:MAG: hypothetical protein Kow00108_21000 [Calditrichia bacterium]
MKKYFWGLTQEQWLILGTIFAVINVGFILREVFMWEASSVSDMFRSDSIMLTKTLSSDINSLDNMNHLIKNDNKMKKHSTGVQKINPVKNFPRININKAGLDSLTMLPGIGPSLAQRIIDYRKQVGKFKSGQELTKVKGIGAKKYNQLKKFIFVGDN